MGWTTTEGDVMGWTNTTEGDVMGWTNTTENDVMRWTNTTGGDVMGCTNTPESDVMGWANTTESDVIGLTNSTDVRAVQAQISTMFLPWNNADTILSYAVMETVKLVFSWVIDPFLWIFGVTTNVINCVIFYKQGLRKDRMNICLFRCADTEMGTCITEKGGWWWDDNGCGVLGVVGLS
jgi:hypothetical protein